MRYRLRNARRKLYLALENLDFIWAIEEVIMFQEYWFHGYSLSWIADSFKRDLDEAALLVIDLAHLGFIKPRKFGLKTSPKINLDEKCVNRLIAHISRDKLTRYTALEDFNFCWDDDEVSLFRKQWRHGISLMEIAHFFNRHQIEVVMLIIDQARNGLIKERKHGIYGKGGEVGEFVTNRNHRAAHQSGKNQVVQLSLS